MNKRFLSMLLVLTIAVTALAACNNGNTGNAANNTGSETVTNSDMNTNGPTDEPAIGNDSEKTENNTNSENSETSEPADPNPTETPAPHVHVYTDTVTTEAACTKAGVKTFTCECGDSYTEEIAATGHKYGEYVYNNDATSSKDGTKTAACSKCGKEDTKTASGTKLDYTYTLLSVEMLVIDGVNVRNTPSTDGKKIGKLNAGEIVFVHAKCNETGWYQIDYDTGYGYVSSKYLVADGQMVGNIEYINGFMLDYSDPFGGTYREDTKNMFREAARATYYEPFEFQSCDGIGITYPCEQEWRTGTNPETGKTFRVWGEDTKGTSKNGYKAEDILEAYADNLYGAGNYKFDLVDVCFADEYENGYKVSKARYCRIVPLERENNI